MNSSKIFFNPSPKTKKHQSSIPSSLCANYMLQENCWLIVHVGNHHSHAIFIETLINNESNVTAVCAMNPGKSQFKSSEQMTSWRKIENTADAIALHDKMIDGRNSYDAIMHTQREMVDKFLTYFWGPVKLGNVAENIRIACQNTGIKLLSGSIPLSESKTNQCSVQ